MYNPAMRATGVGRPGLEMENLNGQMAQMLLRPLRNANRTTVLLLLSLAALNMPQAMVLCIGHDGHVAIEPAGHDHCADGSHSRDRGRPAWRRLTIRMSSTAHCPALHRYPDSRRGRRRTHWLAEV